MYKKLLALFFIGCFLNSCTKDDVCSEGTPATPKLIISFKNYDNPLFSKTVNNLTVSTVVEGDSIHIYRFETTDSIAIPLNTNMDFTDYLLVKDDDSDNPGNIDKINFNYQRESVYINRACAFKAVYTQMAADLEIEEDNWIDETTVNKFRVEDEKDTHVTIFH